MYIQYSFIRSLLTHYIHYNNQDDNQYFPFLKKKKKKNICVSWCAGELLVLAVHQKVWSGFTVMLPCGERQFIQQWDQRGNILATLKTFTLLLLFFCFQFPQNIQANQNVRKIKNITSMLNKNEFYILGEERAMSLYFFNTEYYDKK